MLGKKLKYAFPRAKLVQSVTGIRQAVTGMSDIGRKIARRTCPFPVSFRRGLLVKSLMECTDAHWHRPALERAFINGKSPGKGLVEACHA
jgi:hypothetical protein